MGSPADIPDRRRQHFAAPGQRLTESQREAARTGLAEVREALHYVHPVHPHDAPAVDWLRLRSAATEAAATARAPYSGLHVGAAGVTHTGALVTGCNVESASYGLTLCAECGLVSSLQRGQVGQLVGLSVLSREGRILTPCGRCRQLLFEVAGPGLLVDHPSRPRPISELLPDAFSMSPQSDAAD